MDPSEPARQFAERAIKSLQEFSRESEELDRAFLRGRVGELLKKYNKKYAAEEESEDKDENGGSSTDDDKPETGELEGEAGGPKVPHDPRACWRSGREGHASARSCGETDKEDTGWNFAAGHWRADG